jgi:hypothetical protein
MRIKVDPKTRNRYIQADDIWVRDYTIQGVKAIDCNPLFTQSDREIVVKNEAINSTLGLMNIAEETVTFRNVVIISDGYQFDERHKILQELPPDVSIIAVNKAAAKWAIKDKRAINLYLVNNPYGQDNSLRASNYFPTCVASTRTNSDFVRNYRGNIFFYHPTPDAKFGKPSPQKYYIDDYRNPICAAVSLAFRFGVRKLLLFGCDNAFSDRREAAEQLENGLWTYPQHFKSQKLIDAQLYWLTHQDGVKVETADYSSGPKYQNAAYISEEQQVIEFFVDKEIGGSVEPTK